MHRGSAGLAGSRRPDHVANNATARPSETALYFGDRKTQGAPGERPADLNVVVNLDLAAMAKEGSLLMVPAASVGYVADQRIVPHSSAAIGGKTTPQANGNRAETTASGRARCNVGPRSVDEDTPLKVNRSQSAHGDTSSVAVGNRAGCLVAGHRPETGPSSVGTATEFAPILVSRPGAKAVDVACGTPPSRSSCYTMGRR